MNTVIHLINGILNFPGDSQNWNGRGVTWLHTHTQCRAEKIEYFCGPIDRAFGQKERAEKLFRTMSFYGDWTQHLVGHSNGADVALTALRMPNAGKVERLHLVCGAAEADLEKNGLNGLLMSGQVGQVFVYVAGEDAALRLASKWPSRLLGYGCLGLHGPLNVLPAIVDRVKIIMGGPWVHYGHSDCWGVMEFDETMKNFVP